MALWYSEFSDRPIDTLPWFFTLACYKLGTILEGRSVGPRLGKRRRNRRAITRGRPLAVPQGGPDDRVRLTPMKLSDADRFNEMSS